MNLHSYFPAIVYFVLVRTVHNVPVRLIGGSGPHEGRLEVFVKNKWGTVYKHDSFGYDGNVEPNLICRQFGYQGFAFATNSAVFGQGSRPNVYDNIDCGYYYNMPRSIDDCQIKETNNDRGQPVGVICNVTAPPQVRLVGGSGDHEGRLEVFFQGKWGSVCHYPNQNLYDREYAPNNAKVVCNTLGYSEGTSVISSSQFGSGSGHVWLSELKCKGSEGYIHECVNQWGNEHSDCDDHSLDVSVICNVTSGSNEIRLVGGSGPHEGRVEIRYNGQWGTLRPRAVSWRATMRSYDENQDSSAAVICRQLGYENGESFEVSSQVFGAGSGLQWETIKFCIGFHTFPCISRAESSNEPGDHSFDIGVLCNVKTAPQIRLVDGTTPHEGRVEMLLANQWGTLCDRPLSKSLQNETENEVKQLCNRLGYSGRDMSKPLTTKEFGNGALQNDYIFSTSCLEQSTKMTSCDQAYAGLAGHCDYLQNDAAIGITCNGSTSAVPVQLVGGSGPYEGVVQIYQQGEWGSICVSDMREWGQAEATVICNQLGYIYRPRYDPDNKRILGVNQPTSADIFGAYSVNDIKLDRVDCSSAHSDSILKDCDLGEWGGRNLCDRTHNVGVVCGVRNPLPPLIRLVGGKNPYEGRLEVFFQDEWGTICHEKDWDYEQLPSVVCEQIGVDGGKAELSREYGPGEGRLWLERVNCEGGEAGIDSCRHAAWGSATCDHSLDIGIKCNVYPSGIHPGLVAGVIVGVIVIFIIILIIVLIIKKRQK